MSSFGGRLKGKYVFSEEVLADKFFHVSSKSSAVGGLVSLTVMVRTIIFYSAGSCQIGFGRIANVGP